MTAETRRKPPHPPRGHPVGVVRRVCLPLDFSRTSEKKDTLPSLVNGILTTQTDVVSVSAFCAVRRGRQSGWSTRRDCSLRIGLLSGSVEKTFHG